MPQGGAPRGRVHPLPREGVPPKRRDKNERLKDEFLLSLASVFADEPWTKTHVARELGAHVRSLTRWLLRKKAPRDAATRDHLREGISRHRRDPNR